MTELSTTTAPVLPARPASSGGSLQGDVAPAARQPVGWFPASTVGVVTALVLVGLGVAGVHDALIRWQVLGRTGTPWTTWVLDAVNGWRPATISWLLVAAVLAVPLGLLVLVLALRPRTKPADALDARGGVWLDRSSADRIAVDAAQSVDGVRSASASTSRTAIVVTVAAASPDPRAFSEYVANAVRDRLAAVRPPRTVSVRVRDPWSS